MRQTANVSEPGNGTLVDRVAAEIREAILSGRFEPGSHIPQNPLAEELGTSRLPVREALRQLEHEGLVTLRLNAGARVAPLSIAELNEVYMIRERIEPLALGASIPNLTAAQIDDLRERVERMEEVAADGDVWGWLDVDLEFHRRTFGAAGLPHVLRLAEAYGNMAIRYRRVYAKLVFPTSLGFQHAEHRLLLNAIERRDAVDAERILELHIRRTRVTLSEQPERFTAPNAG